MQKRELLDLSYCLEPNHLPHTKRCRWLILYMYKKNVIKYILKKSHLETFLFLIKNSKFPKIKSRYLILLKIVTKKMSATLIWNYPYSTVILKEYLENFPLKSSNIAKIFIKLLGRFLKYCRNLAMSVQNIIYEMLLQY